MTDTKKDSDYLLVNMSETEQTCTVARALSSPQRLAILDLLNRHQILNVGEIAEAIGLPVSSASHHITILEKAGLISSEKQPSLRGVVKMCSRARNEVVFQLGEKEQPSPRHLMQQLPIGAYSRIFDIRKPCGLASDSAPIGVYNNVRSFYLPERYQAEVLWFRGGYLDYDFSLLPIEKMNIQWIEISFEACSQAPVTTQSWESDIELSINAVCLGRQAVGCESRGRRGSLNPDWWPDIMTQAGKLHTWRVDADGTFINKERAGNTTIDQLGLLTSDKVSIRIAAPEVDHPGINLFGLRFGDHKQSIVMEVGYTLPD